MIRNFELDLGLSFRNASYDGGSNTGLNDLQVGGRYQFKEIFSPKTAFSAGGYMTLPVGADDVGAGLFHFGGFAAMRHALNPGFILTGNVGIQFVDNGNDHDASLRLGVGGIIPVSSRLRIVPELSMITDPDYMNLTGGVDYSLRKNMRLRGGIGLGLDDGAPDFTAFGSMLFFL